MSSKKPDTRTRILDTAWKLLEQGRGGEVRMSDIARAVGISRQALYLHFPNRAELLVETTRHIDTAKKVDERLAASRAARSGVERLDRFIEAWGNYIPEVYGVAHALMAMEDTDPEARHAWQGRMHAVRHGCAAVVEDLVRDKQLDKALGPVQATDLLWTLLSVRNWEHLTIDCGWPQEVYIEEMKTLTRKLLLAR